MEVQLAQNPMMVPAPAVRTMTGVRDRTVCHPTPFALAPDAGLTALGAVVPTGDIITGVGIDTHRRPSLE